MARMAKELGHTIIEPVGSLVPLESPEADCALMQGLSLRNVAVKLLDAKGKVLYKDFGELLFTHFGVSGPTVLSASAHMKGDNCKLVIDLKPALSHEQLYKRVSRDFEKYINKEELRIMLHISKRKATWMLENGVIPCINSGKKTRQFKIKLSDVEEFVRTGKEINAPVGQFSAAKYNKRKLIHTRLTEQELASFREYLTYKFRHKPDALTIIQAKKLIGYLPEQPPLYVDMTVEEYLTFVYELKGCTLNRKKHIQEVCEVTKISDVYNRIIRNLSKGYRQRVGLAQAMIGEPELLILDEPTTGLDPNQLEDIRALIREMGEQRTVILSTHILQEVKQMCTRVVIINHGEIKVDKPISEIEE